MRNGGGAVKTPSLPIADRVLILHSGGMESAAMTFWAARNYGEDNVLCVGFDFGGWHPGRHELIVAEEQCNRLGVSFLKLSMRDEYHNNRGLILQGTNMFDDKMRELYPAPFSRKRNIIMAGVGVSVAFNYNRIPYVLIGLECVDDREGLAARYRDDAFFGGINTAIDNHPDLRGDMATVMSPFHEPKMTKVDIVQAMIADGGGEDLGRSFSCFHPVGFRHCGHCESCRDRRLAYERAGAEDPTEYA